MATAHRPFGAKKRVFSFGLSRAAESYVATVAAHTSDHGPFSPLVLTQRRAQYAATARVRAREVGVQPPP
ncbi:MAG: hypothetical protein HBSAPP03_22410 [Phycisphaerae bacterium]|nr:MAG: hypothetical protein HBSAPP03_22410 [Phycisphaerae bacterium]